MPRGRTAGTPNKPRRLLEKRLQEAYGEDFHMIMEMVANNVKLQQELDEKLPGMEIDEIKDAVDTVNRNWERAAKFVYPQVKAVEVSGINEEPLRVTVEWGNGKDS